MEKIYLDKLPRPELLTPVREKKLTLQSFKARYGKLALDFIVIDVERKQTENNDWKISEIAAYLVDTDLKLKPIKVSKDIRYKKIDNREKQEWKDVLNNKIVIGHNAGGDYDHLIKEGYLDSCGIIDSIELSVLAYPGLRKYSLENICKQLKILEKNQHQKHSAPEDAALCWEVVQSSVKEIGRWNIQKQKAILQLLHKDSYLKKFLLLKLGLKESDISTIRINADHIYKIEPLNEKFEMQDAGLKHIKASDIFDDSGILNKSNMIPREEQRHLSEDIERVINEGKYLFAEAPTGIGKSIGALLPSLIYSCKERKPVIFSTYSHLLQSQMIDEDLEKVGKLLNYKPKAILLKGSENLIDLENYELFRRRILSQYRGGDDSIEYKNRGLITACLLSYISYMFENENPKDKNIITAFTGDLIDFPAIIKAFYAKDYTYVTSHITKFGFINVEQGDTDKEQARQESLFHRALRYAKSANIVIVNHSLWFCSDKVREISDSVIFDEAHHIEDAVLSANTKEFSTFTLVQALTNLGILLNHSERFEKQKEKVLNLSEFFKHYCSRIISEYISKKEKNTMDEESQEIRIYAAKVWLNENFVMNKDYSKYFNVEKTIELISALKEIIPMLKNINAGSKTTIIIKHFKELFEDYIASIKYLAALNTDADETPICYWLEENSEDIGANADERSFFCVKKAPVKLDIIIRDNLKGVSSAVFMSATLSLKDTGHFRNKTFKDQETEGFEYIKNSLGLGDKENPDKSRCSSYKSSFDYPAQMRFYSYNTFRSPTDPKIEQVEEYLQELLYIMLNISMTSAKNIMYLFTARAPLLALGKAMKETVYSNKDKLESTVLWEKFLELILHYKGYKAEKVKEKYIMSVDKKKNPLILGTGSLWTGLDLPELKALVFPRLPFPSVMEPWVEAKCHSIDKELEGKSSSFIEYVIPQTIMKWKQGIGRLIRNNKSKGVVICLDPRITERQYGTKFIEALPYGLKTGKGIKDYDHKDLEELMKDIAEFLDNREIRKIEVKKKDWLPPKLIFDPISEQDNTEVINEKIEDALRSFIGPSDYIKNEKQINSINNFLNNKDTIVGMPTGEGKSLCYQVPALLAADSGLTLVISPLIALIKDQVKNITAIENLKDYAGCVVGSKNQKSGERSRVERLIRKRTLRLVYMTPEMALQYIKENKMKDWNIKRIVYDEAHCIKEWGERFRPKYLSLVREARDKFRDKASFMAVSATLDKNAVSYLEKQLCMNNPGQYRLDIDRPNIFWSVERIDGYFSKYWEAPVVDKLSRLLQMLDSMDRNKRAIIYANYIFTCDFLSSLLSQRYKVVTYHSGVKKNEILYTRLGCSPEKDARVIIATKAFGMGVDIKDVQMVVHYSHPESIKEYYQQAGRAGREKTEQAYAITLFNETDQSENKWLIDLNKKENINKQVLDILENSSENNKRVFSIEELDIKKDSNGYLADGKTRKFLEILAARDKIKFGDVYIGYKLIRQRSLAENEIEPNEIPPIIKDDILDFAKSSDINLDIKLSADLKYEEYKEIEEFINNGSSYRLWEIKEKNPAYFIQAESKVEIEEIQEEEIIARKNELNKFCEFLKNDEGCRRKNLIFTLDSESHKHKDYDICCDLCHIRKRKKMPYMKKVYWQEVNIDPKLWLLSYIKYMEDNKLKIKDENIERVTWGTSWSSKDKRKKGIRAMINENLIKNEDGVISITPAGEKHLEKKRIAL